MAEVQKWGFGAAPFKPDTLNKNRTALRYILSYINNQPIKKNIDICTEISIVKGFFNCIIRQHKEVVKKLFHFFVCGVLVK